jgi:hypothetical protein
MGLAQVQSLSEGGPRRAGVTVSGENGLISTLNNQSHTELYYN